MFRLYPDFPKNTDYVMRFWDKAAALAREGEIVRFGFITTNSISQVSNNQIIKKHLEAENPLSIVYAIPDHPWVDGAGNAKVRIAMTVGEAGSKEGTLAVITKSQKGYDGVPQLEFSTRYGYIKPNLTVGPSLTNAKALKANAGLAFMGIKPVGKGFIITKEKAEELGLGTTPGLQKHIRPYMNGRDVVGINRGLLAIDMCQLNADEVNRCFPLVFQWLHDTVKPIRDQNKMESRRLNWWKFGSAITGFNKAVSGLPRYIVTCNTAKHRLFIFLDSNVIPDGALTAIALDDAFYLGVLSSRVHEIWADATGGTRGQGKVYNKTLSFDGFPFPDANSTTMEKIRELGEAIDQHRKQRQSMFPQLTLTEMYNLMGILRNGDELSERDLQAIEHGQIKDLLEMHDELDETVATSYGWPSDIADAEVLELLIQLNKTRASNE